MDKNLLEITGYDGEGYVPLIDYSHWRVAELRYCEELEVDKLKDMQKHDERMKFLYYWKAISHYS